MCVRERIRRHARRVRPARNQCHRPRARPDRPLPRRGEPGGISRPLRRVRPGRRERGATSTALGLLPCSSVDRARLRGTTRRSSSSGGSGRRIGLFCPGCRPFPGTASVEGLHPVLPAPTSPCVLRLRDLLLVCVLLAAIGVGVYELGHHVDSESASLTKQDSELGQKVYRPTHHSGPSRKTIELAAAGMGGAAGIMVLFSLGSALARPRHKATWRAN